MRARAALGAVRVLMYNKANDYAGLNGLPDADYARRVDFPSAVLPADTLFAECPAARRELPA